MSEILPEDPNKLFPLFIYIYNGKGQYGQPVRIDSRDQLFLDDTKKLVAKAIKSGVEVRITDSDDFLVFHAYGGKIIFNGSTIINGNDAWIN